MGDDAAGTDEKKKVVINVFQTKKPEPLPGVNEVSKTESKFTNESDKAKASIVGAFRLFQRIITLKYLAIA